MNVAKFLNDRDVHFDLIPHSETHDAQRMAATLHVSGHEVAKTVLLGADSGYTCFVALLPANKSIDFDSASLILGGSKLELATEAELMQYFPDCELGAVPPFGSQYGLRTLVDLSLAQKEDIVFEGNTHHEALRINFNDFCELEQPLIGNFVL